MSHKLIDEASRMSALDLYEDLLIHDDKEGKCLTLQEMKSEKQQLQEQNKLLHQQLTEAMLSLSSVTEQNCLLKKNFSSLLETAKLELERKNKVISTLTGSSGSRVIPKNQTNGYIKPSIKSMSLKGRRHGDDAHSSETGRRHGDDAHSSETSRRHGDYAHSSETDRHHVDEVPHHPVHSLKNKSTEATTKGRPSDKESSKKLRNFDSIEGKAPPKDTSHMTTRSKRELGNHRDNRHRPSRDRHDSRRLRPRSTRIDNDERRMRHRDEEEYRRRSSKSSTRPSSEDHTEHFHRPRNRTSKTDPFIHSRAHRSGEVPPSAPSLPKDPRSVPAPIKQRPSPITFPGDDDLHGWSTRSRYYDNVPVVGDTHKHKSSSSSVMTPSSKETRLSIERSTNKIQSQPSSSQKPPNKSNFMVDSSTLPPPSVRSVNEADQLLEKISAAVSNSPNKVSSVLVKPNHNKTLISPVSYTETPLPPVCNHKKVPSAQISNKIPLAPASGHMNTSLTPVCSHQKVHPTLVSSHNKTPLTPASSHNKTPLTPASSHNKTSLSPISAHNKVLQSFSLSKNTSKLSSVTNDNPAIQRHLMEQEPVVPRIERILPPSSGRKGPIEETYSDAAGADVYDLLDYDEDSIQASIHHMGGKLFPEEVVEGPATSKVKRNENVNIVSGMKDLSHTQDHIKQKVTPRALAENKTLSKDCKTDRSPLVRVSSYEQRVDERRRVAPKRSLSTDRKEDAKRPKAIDPRMNRDKKFATRQPPAKVITSEAETLKTPVTSQGSGFHLDCLPAVHMDVSQEKSNLRIESISKNKVKTLPKVMTVSHESMDTCNVEKASGSLVKISHQSPTKLIDKPIKKLNKKKMLTLESTALRRSPRHKKSTPPALKGTENEPLKNVKSKRKLKIISDSESESEELNSKQKLVENGIYSKLNSSASSSSSRTFQVKGALFVSKKIESSKKALLGTASDVASANPTLQLMDADPSLKHESSPHPLSNDPHHLRCGTTCDLQPAVFEPDLQDTSSSSSHPVTSSSLETSTIKELSKLQPTESSSQPITTPILHNQLPPQGPHKQTKTTPISGPSAIEHSFMTYYRVASLQLLLHLAKEELASRRSGVASAESVSPRHVWLNSLAESQVRRRRNSRWMSERSSGESLDASQDSKEQSSQSWKFNEESLNHFIHVTSLNHLISPLKSARKCSPLPSRESTTGESYEKETCKRKVLQSPFK